jgi:hypothetical protein
METKSKYQQIDHDCLKKPGKQRKCRNNEKVFGAPEEFKTREKRVSDIVNLFSGRRRKMSCNPFNNAVNKTMRTGENKHNYHQNDYDAAQDYKMPGFEFGGQNDENGDQHNGTHKSHAIEQDFKHRRRENKRLFQLTFLAYQIQPGHLTCKIRHQQIGHHSNAVNGENMPKIYILDRIEYQLQASRSDENNNCFEK